MGSTRSARAQEMRRVLAEWQRSGLRLREFGEQRGIALSTLRWWRRVFRAAGAAAPVVAFTEVPAPGARHGDGNA
ncbi:MAG: IS66 family insertion sequence element accessory protein TnpA [Candidatus Binataceae bacterium]